MSKPWVNQGRPKMPTKVVSTKIPSDEYDRLIDECNTKGCTLSEFIREKILDSNPTPTQDNSKEKPKESEEMTNLKKQISQLQLDLNSYKSAVSNQEKKITDLYDWLQIKGLGVDPIALNYRNRR
jgi:predicted RNase H-like nuclease (RuvC/YqgF family)